MQKSLIDAGPLIALFDKDDKYHERVMDFLDGYHGQLITTWPVITETLHMLDFDVRAQVDFLRWLRRDAVIIHSLDKELLDHVIELTQKYSDRPMDFADATLLVVSQQSGIRNIITIDSDFLVYRNLRKEMLDNLL